MQVSFGTFNPIQSIKNYFAKVKFEKYRKKRLEELRPEVEKFIKKYEPWQDDYWTREYLQKLSRDIFEEHEQMKTK